ncbi:hypothetical protein TIFTF001_043698 [Ficus carica]|uniref:non-specific serine/threonine protein kinase n=1 Tax=Ficus carica TaxID=3494 RepID=A0AA87YUS4_FICCA|nr:hypothetical protein TIFTF001_043698 [Ficus carica]
MPMLKGTTKFTRSGPWNGLRFSGSPEKMLNPVYGFDFVYNDDELYYIYNLKNKSVISITVMNQTTSVHQRLIWIEGDKTWRTYTSLPRDECDKFGACGANANCMIDDNPMCRCLRGFKPMSQEKWNSMDWAKCLSNCSCTAYANSNISGKGSGCVVWYGDLIDITQFAIGGQDLFIRMPRSELGKTNNKITAAIPVAVIGGVLGLLLLVYFICRRYSKERNQEEDLEVPVLNLSTITTATQNFSLNNKLGEGGFGPVYRGMLEDGKEFAVKRLSISSRQGVNELKNEVKLIAKLQHRNLVKLLGCCIHGEEKLLVYEYMPNKSLDSLIFEYAIHGMFSTKSDVFSFGILILEIVSGKKSRGFQYENHSLTLIGHAWTLHKEGGSFGLIDKHLRESPHNLKQVLRSIHVGLLCVQQYPVDRPCMSSVVVMLGSESELPPPKPPGYFTETASINEDNSSTQHESSSTNDLSITLLEAR